MRNNNQRVITKLSRKSFRSSQLRNIFAILSIALTCLLFTSLSTIGIALNDNIEQGRMRQVGTMAHGGFKDITVEQWDKLKMHPMIKSFSYNIFIGNTTSEKLMKRQGEIRYIADENYTKNHFCNPVEGKIPKEGKDIFLDTITLDLLGIPYELGTTIPLKFDFMGQEYEENFVLCGYYEGDLVLSASQIFISDEYFKQLSKNYTEKDFQEAKEKHLTQGTGLLQVDFYLKNSINIEKNVQKIIVDSGYEAVGVSKDVIEYGINWAYSIGSVKNVDPFTIVALVLALLIIILTGYLIIYNIFQISVVNDIHFYGLLKTIGTTKQQIRMMIQKQVLLLSVIGIPIGLITGYFVGIWLLTVMPKSMTGMASQEVKFNVFIFIFGAIFSLLTILISCRKPAKMAGSISPIEAVKYVENADIRSKKKKKTFGGGKIWRMAFSNLMRNKKKSIIVILSMSLSIILLVEVVTLIHGFQINGYLEQMVNGDFMVASTGYFQQTGGITSVSKEMEEACLSQSGVESYNKLYTHQASYGYMPDDIIISILKEQVETGELQIEAYIQNYFEAVLKKEVPITEVRYAFDENLWDKLKVIEGSFDKEKFLSGNYVLIGQDSDQFAYHKAGDKIHLPVYSKESIIEFSEEDTDNGFPIKPMWKNISQKSYEVMAVVEIPYGMGMRSYPYLGIFTVLPEKEFFEISEGVPENSLIQNYAVLIDVEDEKEKDFQAFLEHNTTYVEPGMQFVSKESLRKEFDGMLFMFQAAGGGLAAIVAFIGILNFINSMFTGVITRKREFALLQSIGMTGAQLMKMLVLEGIYYVIITAVISVTFGSAISILIIRSFNNIIKFFEYSFTWMPFLLTLPAFLIVAVIIPFISYYIVKKQSIVERVKEYS